MDSKSSLQLAKLQNSAQATRDYAFKMKEVKKNLMPPADKEKKLRESCEGFESIFIQKMWEQMRATIPESGLLKGREEKFWQSMYDQELAKTMAGAGGIGLADMMYEQLSRSLRSASKSAADTAGGQSSGFAEAVAPAPLLRAAVPQQAATAAGAAPRHTALAGLYSEAGQPGAAPAPGATSIPAAVSASDVSAAQPVAEDETSPAILAVLNELRAAHQAGAPTHGQQAAAPGSLQTQPGHSYVSTLTKPVHRPASGKRTVLPRAASGPRVPSGQPVNRNLPYPQQETLQAQAQGRLQNTEAAQGAPTVATGKPGVGG